MSSWAKLGKTLLATLCLVAVLVPMSAEPAQGATCVDVLGLWARGSERSQTLDSDSVGRAWRDALGANLPKATVRVESAVYPASGNLVELITAQIPFFEYRDSMRQGRDWIRDRVREAAADCPSQKIVLGGESQGAHAITDALLTNSDLWNEVSAVTLYGSPIHNEAPGVFGPRDAQRVNRGEQWLWSGVGALGGVKWNDDAIGVVQSWCIRNDPVCDYRNAATTAASFSNHLKYVARGYVADAVVELARENLPQFRNTNQANPICRGVETDLVLTSADDTLVLNDFGYVLNGVGMIARSYTAFALLGGDDTANVDGPRMGSVTLCAGSGNDTIKHVSGSVKLRLRGGPGSDVLYGGPRADSIYGDGGNDTIRGLGGKDKIYGGAGADELRGNGGADNVRGGPGNDELFGGAGNDTLNGDDGYDVADGRSGTDGCWAEVEANCEY